MCIGGRRKIIEEEQELVNIQSKTMNCQAPLATPRGTVVYVCVLAVMVLQGLNKLI